VVRPERFELPAFWFVARRSIQLSYGRIRVQRIAAPSIAEKSPFFKPKANSRKQRLRRRPHQLLTSYSTGTKDMVVNTRCEDVPHIIENLRALYGMPKRERYRDALDCLIETILSQSTSNTNSHRAYANLKARFPTWEQARRARPSSIESAIRAGGLARQKSTRIKNLLNEIYQRRGSLDLSFLRVIPLDEAVRFLLSFKGVGPKTAACTLLFACNRPAFPIDVHIFRIARRLGLLPEKCSDEQAHQIMARTIPVSRYYEAHINLIKHGRQICRPSKPRCEDCCLVDYCHYYREQP
jgi:endonuclease III